MTRARDVANVLSTATDLATDTETAAAISAHNSVTNGHTSRGNTASRPASPTAGDIYVNTQTGFVEVYTGATYGWEQVGGISSTPTSVVATDLGTGRAYNNGSASIAFSPGTIAGRSYTVTSSPGSYTATGSTSPISITGLQSNTSYTYTVTATNNYGTSSASSASTGVTATTVPQAPTIGTATEGDASATLEFTAGGTGGSSITNYKYSTDNSTYTAFSPAQTSSPLSISGLTNGTSYSFYLKAVNTNGDSIASSASNSVTPALPGSFESIDIVNVVGNTSYIQFNDIPSTYKHLQIRLIARVTSGGQYCLVTINGDGTSSNYSSHYMESDGSSAYVYGGANSRPAFCQVSSVANNYQPSIIDILDYTSTNKTKTFKGFFAQDFNNTSGTATFMSGAWYNSSTAISTIRITPNYNAMFAAGSTFALYGVK